MPEKRAGEPGRLRGEFMGVKEVAEAPGWSKAKVSEYQRRGKLPPLAFTIAAGPVWERKEIEALKNPAKKAEPIAVSIHDGSFSLSWLSGVVRQPLHTSASLAGCGVSGFILLTSTYGIDTILSDPQASRNS